MRYLCLLLLIITFSTLTGCKENELDAKIKALVEQTKKNMVFVQGGSFMMGDPGTEVTDEYGNTQRLPITMWTNDDYVHKVTLDSYYINKFETTYAEFDLFCKATGRELYNKDFFDHELRCESCPTAVPNCRQPRTTATGCRRSLACLLTFQPKPNGSMPPVVGVKMCGMQRIPANWIMDAISSQKKNQSSTVSAHTLRIRLAFMT